MTHTCRLLRLLAVIPVVAAGCSRPPANQSPPAEISAVLEISPPVPVQRSEISDSLELVGTLLPWRGATIVAEVDGVIQRLPIYDKPIRYEVAGTSYTQPVTLDIGHEVSEGDVLVELDKGPYQLALNAAQAKLDLANAELANVLAWKRTEEVEQLEAQAEEAAAVLAQADLDLDRCKRLSKKDMLSECEQDSTEKAHRTAVAAKRRADAALKLGKAGPTPQQIAVEEASVQLAQAEVALRQDELNKCSVYCPFDAVITDRYVGVGDRVTALPRVEIMQIADPSVLFAQVAVPEEFHGMLKTNDRALVQAPGVSEPVPGVVALINEKIDPETRTFRVR
ncbi:MAG: efflux RND transporter periplasmic adaptor subunit, partial [Planctomycetota bacterium]